jgi:hypothetical protein
MPAPLRPIATLASLGIAAALVLGAGPALSQLPVDIPGTTEVPPPFALDFNQPMPTGVSPELTAEAQSIVQQFVGTLLPTLQLAIAAGGPAHAIEVCAVEAPAIAERLSAQTGWDVSRVSLKARNSNATPDGWEAVILSQWDQRHRGGEPGANMNTAEMVSGQFRYMQAQPAAPLCLTCHGTSISDEVKSVLQQRYPNDMATGYVEGQIRGAISLIKLN